MRDHTKILEWENERRLNKLAEFRQLVIEYFNNIDLEWISDRKTENEVAQMARVKISRIMDDVHSIILGSKIKPILTRVSALSSWGTRVRQSDLILNIFNLDELGINPNDATGFHR